MSLNASSSLSSNFLLMIHSINAFTTAASIMRRKKIPNKSIDAYSSDVQLPGILQFLAIAKCTQLCK